MVKYGLAWKRFLAISVIIISFLSIACCDALINDASPESIPTQIDCISLASFDQTAQPYNQFIYFIVEGDSDKQASTKRSLQIIQEFVNSNLQPGDRVIASWMGQSDLESAVFLDVTFNYDPDLVGKISPTIDYREIDIKNNANLTQNTTATEVPEFNYDFEKISASKTASALQTVQAAQQTLIAKKRICQTATSVELLDNNNSMMRRTMVADTITQFAAVTPDIQDSSAHLIKAIDLGEQAIQGLCLNNSSRPCKPKMIILSDFDDPQTGWKITTIDLSNIDVYLISWNCRYLFSKTGCGKNITDWKNSLRSIGGNVFVNSDKDFISSIKKP